jgi:hypothetical protein
MSVFWNQNDTTRQLVYGSAYNEVPSSGAQTLNYGGSRLFNVNNDIDCLGDVILEVGITRNAANSVAVDYVSSDDAAAASLGAQEQTIDLLYTPTSQQTFTGMLGTQLGFFDQMILEVQHEYNGQTTTILSEVTESDGTTVVGAGLNSSNSLPTLQNIIDRIEVQVGTQIWQTLEHEDLEVCNATELSAGAYSEINRQCTAPSANTTTTNQTSNTPLEQKAYLRVPCFTKTIQPPLSKYTEQTEDGYPMAAAPHQSVKFKVDFSSDDSVVSQDHTDPAIGATPLFAVLSNPEPGSNHYNITAEDYFFGLNRGGILQLDSASTSYSSPGQGQDPKRLQVMWDAEWESAGTFSDPGANNFANFDATSPGTGYGIGVIDYTASISLLYTIADGTGAPAQTFSAGNLSIRLTPAKKTAFAANCYAQYIGALSAGSASYSQQFIGRTPVWGGGSAVKSIIADYQYGTSNTGTNSSVPPAWVKTMNCDGNGNSIVASEPLRQWDFISKPLSQYVGGLINSSSPPDNLLSYETGGYLNETIDTEAKQWHGIVQSMTAQSWRSYGTDSYDEKKSLLAYSAKLGKIGDQGPIASIDTIVGSINVAAWTNNLAVGTANINTAWEQLNLIATGSAPSLGWGAAAAAAAAAVNGSTVFSNSLPLRLWSVFQGAPGVVAPGGDWQMASTFVPNGLIQDSVDCNQQWAVNPAALGQSDGSTNSVFNQVILSSLPTTLSQLFTAAESFYAPPTITACRMFAKQQIMCNEEREEIKSMPHGLPKRLKMTQNAFSTPLLSGSKPTYTMDLDHFSLYASYLVIAIETHDLFSAELKLNSSSFSGALPGPLLYSASSESLGIYGNKNIFASNNTLAGGSAIDDQSNYHYYVFPLAATAYSGSAVPLNRFDSIRLMLTFAHGYPSGSPPQKISVTCVGETTALFKDGAASLAMY